MRLRVAASVTEPFLALILAVSYPTIDMEVIEDIGQYNWEGGACVTVGTFDGLHIGHRKIIKELVQNARSCGLRSVVITFDPHPRQVLAKGSVVRFVLTRKEKVEMMSTLGVDVLIIHPFSKEFAALTAKDFLVDMLCARLNMKCLVKGFNNHFGCDRLSDLDALETLGSEHGFEVVEVAEECHGGVTCSSTVVRRMIAEGRMGAASAVLGYDYFVEGTVVHGRMIGRTIGFPTANVYIGDDSKILPRPGAYVATVEFDGSKWPAILNIGSNPTVNDECDRVFLEAHLIGFEGDLYGRRIRVNVLRHIRNEVKFGSLSELKQQLQQDEQVAVSVIAQYAS